MADKSVPKTVLFPAWSFSKLTFLSHPFVMDLFREDVGAGRDRQLMPPPAVPSTMAASLPSSRTDYEAEVRRLESMNFNVICPKCACARPCARSIGPHVHARKKGFALKTTVAWISPHSLPHPTPSAQNSSCTARGNTRARIAHACSCCHGCFWRRYFQLVNDCRAAKNRVLFFSCLLYFGITCLEQIVDVTQFFGDNT